MGWAWDTVTLLPHSMQISESGSLLLRPCFTSTWLAWRVEGFGIKLIFHRTWYLKELTFKLQADLMGISSLAAMNCDGIPFLGVCLVPSLHGSLSCNFLGHLGLERKGNL